MFHLNNPAAQGMVAATLFGLLVLATPSWAASGDQTAQATPAAEKEHHGRKPRAERVEDRIKTLHDKLGITPQQEPQFGAVAQVMRDNAAATDAAIQKRHENTATMTAVEDLKAYQQIADTHSQGLQKLIPAFETLYASLSDEQKKTADDLFGHPHGGRHHHGKRQAKNKE